jgi:immune inhibitor A
MKTPSWRAGPKLALLALVVALFAGAAALQSRPDGAHGAVKVSARDYYYNLSAPLVDMESGDVEVSPNGRGSGGGGGSSDLKKWWSTESRKHSQGFPRAANQLAKIEAKALKTGENPRQLKQSKTTTHAKLLTVLAEFNPTANDDFSGFRRLRDINGAAGVDCVTEPAGTTFSGPVHNQLEDPADFGKDGTPNTIDNNTFWVPDFNPEHFTKMMFSTNGITDRVRTDLTGPDGKPGFDISGYTMKNMYREMSKGAYDLSGQVRRGSCSRTRRRTTRPTRATPVARATRVIRATHAV